jgi:hypothetical protein
MTPRQKNLLTLTAIIGIFVAFAVAGRLVNVSQLDKTNKGHLIVPHVPLDKLQLTEAGKPFGNQQVGHWSLMYIADAHCEAACKNALFYQMQRTRQALGEQGRSLQLLAVATGDDPALPAFIHAKTPDVTLLQGHTPWVKAALKTSLGGNSALGRVFLISPDGMVFMWYDSHADKDGTIVESSHIYDDVRTTLKGSLTG